MNPKFADEFKRLFARRQNHDRAFTLPELLAVLAILGLLTVVLLPALADTRNKSFQCLNNMRQLGFACLLYANDNKEKLVTNSDRESAGSAANWICPYGVTLDWTARSKNTNTLYLTIDSPALGTALLAPYVAHSTKVFLCPADRYLSGVQRSAGFQNRIRSCAMDGAMGDGPKWFAPGSGGNWPNFYNVKKTTDMHTPGPANCWLVMDEHPDSDGDACLYVNPAQATGNGTGSFIGLPGSMHDNAAGMVFADGHSELHVWKDPQTIQPVNFTVAWLQSVSVISDQDLVWLAQHTPQN